MRPHRVVVLDVLTKHPPQMPFVDGDDVIEALAPERPDHPLGDGVGVRRAHRSQNRLDPDPSSACCTVPGHLARGIPAFEAASGEQCSTLQLPPAAGRRVSLTGHPVGRAMLDPSGRPGPGWTLQVLWGETWQSLKPIRVSANAGANGRGFGPSGRNHLLRCSCDVAGTSGRLPAPRRKSERTARPEQRGLSASARRGACASDPRG